LSKIVALFISRSPSSCFSHKDGANYFTVRSGVRKQNNRQQE